jgi:hypothetical protein
MPHVLEADCAHRAGLARQNRRLKSRDLDQVQFDRMNQGLEKWR